MTVAIRILMSCLFVAGFFAGTALADNDNSLSIRTRDWINPQFRDIHANVLVQRLNERAFSLKYAFDVPLDPVRGVNPSEFHIFTFCLAGRLSAMHGYPNWAMGMLDKDVKYSNTMAIEIFVAVLNADEKPEISSRRDDIHWLVTQTNVNSNFIESCSKLLRPEFMWKSRDNL